LGLCGPSDLSLQARVVLADGPSIDADDGDGVVDGPRRIRRRSGESQLMSYPKLPCGYWSDGGGATGMAAIEVIGELAARPLSEPWTLAVPKLRTVPFCSAIQSPVPSGVTAKPTTRDVTVAG